MPSIDERVVAMSFENAKFEAGVAQTMSTLGKLDTALKNIGNTQGLQNIEAAANKVTLQQPMSALDKLKARLFGAGQGAAQGMSEIDKAGDKVSLTGPLTAIDKVQARVSQVGLGAAEGFGAIEKTGNSIDLRPLNQAIDSVQSHFSAMTVVATSALSTITMDAVRRGKTFASSFALGPIKQGFAEYSTNLNSIQTILANTQDSGGNLKTVNAALNELNTYSDKTIYNFSEMAKNIGTFTAAGVRLKPATAAIKGIANLAALSGSNSQQASTAMYQLSQAIAAGKVGLQDWNSVVNAGMGGAVFQKALMRTAENMGTIEKGAIKIDKATGKATVNGQSFRESIMAKPGQKSWLSSEVLTNTLSQFTGDMTDAQLAAKGFSAEQIKAIQAQAKTAQAAATQVKTIGQVFDVAKETIGSGWSKTFQLIFGDFGESKKTFTALSNSINGFINKISNARNALLGGWKEMGGRTKLLEGIKDLFKGIFGWLKPIGAAFRDIFPKKTSSDLFAMTKNFADFSKAIAPSKDTIENLKNTFRGLFAALDIGWQVIKGVGTAISQMLGAVGQSSGGLLKFTGSIGNFVTSLDQSLKKSDAFKSFFVGLGKILSIPIHLIGVFIGLVSNLFGGVKTENVKGLADSLGGVTQALSPMQKIVATLSGVWKRFLDVLGRVGSIVDRIFPKLRGAFGGIVDTIKSTFDNIDWEKLFLGLQAGMLAGIFVTLKKALGGGIKVDLTGGLLGKVKGMLDGVTGSLKSMQQAVKAATILEIATALAVLSGGIKIISTIDPKRLTSSMLAISVGLGELVGAMALVKAIGGGFVQVPFIAAGMIALAAAVDVLAIAVKAMSTLSWDELTRGLTGVAGVLVAISAGVRLMPANIVLVGPALIPLSAGLIVLAGAVKIFSTFKWKELAKGLIGVVGALAAVALGISLMPTGQLLAAGPGLILVSTGLALLSGAVKSFGNMDLVTLGKGLIGIASSLVVIGAAMMAIPPTIGLQAAGLLLVSVALTGVATAVGLMGSIPILTLAKGLIGIGAALVVLAVGLTAMSGALPGSLALVAAAGGLAILVPAIALLGAMPIKVIFKGVVAMAAAIGVLAAVGAAASVPLLALGTGLLGLGLGLTAIAAAVYLASKGVSLLAADGQKGVAALMVALTGLVALLPTLVINFVKGVVAIVEQVALVAPKVTAALATIITQLLGLIVKEAPQLALAMGSLIDAMILVIGTKGPPLAEAGFKLLTAFLGSVSSHLPDVLTSAEKIVTTILGHIASAAPRLVAQGVTALVSFLGGIVQSLPRVIVAAARIIGTFLGKVTSELPNIIAAGAKMVVTFLTGIANKLPSVIDAGVHVIIKFLDGIGHHDNIGRIERKGVWLVGKFLDAMADGARRLADKIGHFILNVLDALDSAIQTYGPQITSKGLKIGQHLIEGMVKGIFDFGGVLKHAIQKVFHLLPGWARDVLGIHSPSTVFAEIGSNVIAGMVSGLGDMHGVLKSSITDPIQLMIRENKGLGEFGKFIGGEFKAGLTGGLFTKEQSASTTAITGAFTSLRAKLHEEQAKLRDAIKQDQDKLKQELAKDPAKRDDSLIAKLSGNIAANRNLLSAATTATDQLMGRLRTSRTDLINLGKAYELVSKRLQDAQSALDTLKTDKKSMVDNLTKQFDALPNVDDLVTNALADADLTAQERRDKEQKAREDAAKKRKIDQVALYKKALQEQIDATKKYNETLQQLRAAGLDDQTYQKLLDQGLKGQDFATALLASGKTGIDGINKLDADLLGASGDLAKNAASKMYDAGIAAAEGVLKGLQDKKGEIESVMKEIADSMVGAIKDKLGIRSPSKVFMEVAKFSAQGMIYGLNASAKDVAIAAEGVGDTAVSALQNSMQKINDYMSIGIDANPTITPVLDLSQIKKDAEGLNGIGGTIPMTGVASYGLAASISSETQQTAAAAADSTSSGAPVLKFEQTNISPEALSPAEIYRQTNNQLSIAKRALLGLAPPVTP